MGDFSSYLGAEWTYLLQTRVVAGSNNAFSFVRLKYGNNATDTVTGVVIYPDDFSFADAGVGAMTFGAAAPTAIDIDSWKALETAGCVFLPGNRERAYSSGSPTILDIAAGLYFGYWGSNGNSASQASHMYFTTGSSIKANATNRFYGFNVRLVQDL